jgi:copper chaperone CopZ
VGKLREPLMKVEGVKEVKADVEAELVTITFDARRAHAADLHEAILQSGYEPAPVAS